LAKSSKLHSKNKRKKKEKEKGKKEKMSFKLKKSETFEANHKHIWQNVLLSR